MTLRRPRSRTGARILTGIVRVLAAVILAIAASAALADLNLHSVDFFRMLPVVLTGEGIVYILMLGGGSVIGQVLLLTVFLTFALRASIAVAAAALSPQAGGDLLAGAQFYYAAYWPSAVAQVLMMAVMLRLIRPLIRRRPTYKPIARPKPDDSEEEERRDLLLVALTESPQEPPESPTALEELQIGDLAEVQGQPPASAPAVAEEQTLPFDEEAPEEAEEEEPEDDTPLPPGVIDARPGIVAEAEAEADEPEDDTPLPPGVIDARPGIVAAQEAEAEEPDSEASEEEAEPVASEAAPTDEVLQEADLPSTKAEQIEKAPVVCPGEDTERLEPLRRDEPEFDLGEVTPPENLQEMVGVISGAAGAGCDVRVWGTSDGRTVLAAVPSGTPAAGTATHADALVNTHLDLCARMGEGNGCQQLVMTSLGGWAVQSLDSDGGVMLIMASRDERAIGRLQMATERTSDALRGMAAAAGAVPRPKECGEVPLSPEAALGEQIEAAADTVGGRFVDIWRVWRGPHRRLVAAVAPPGGDARRVAAMAAQAITPVERFADAIALDRPQWMAIASGSSLLVLVWAEIGGEPVVMSALASGEAAVGRARWELAEIAREADRQQ